MTQAAESIEMKVNAKALVNNLELSFTGSDQYLAELMQNARRAGASYVEFSYDDQARSLTVLDDGHGVQDMQDLLNVAFSGWEDEIQQSETPYGIGFLSAIFQADYITVESNGKKVEIDKRKALDFEKIEVTRGSMETGTVVRLEGNFENPEQPVRTYARGFSIPVYVNGDEMERPCARDSLAFRETSFGWIHIAGMDGLDQPDLRKASTNTTVFLQDQSVLRVGRPFGRDSNVVHLDPKQFFGRIPDRDTLIEDSATRAKAEINKYVEATWVNHLVALKDQMEPREFVERHLEDLRDFGVVHLLNDIGVLPRNALKVLDGYPVVDMGEFGVMEPPHQSPSRAEIADGTIRVGKLHTCFGDGADDEPANASMFAHLMKDSLLLLRDSSLNGGHWVHEHAVDLADGEIVVELHGASHYASSNVGRVVFCESATLSHPVLGSVTTSTDAFAFSGDRAQVANSDEELEALGLNNDDFNCIVMPAEEKGSSVVGQVCSFMDEWNDFDDAEQEQVSAQFHQFLLANRPGQETDAISDALQTSGVHRIDALKGRQFTVSITDDGNVTVEAL